MGSAFKRISRNVRLPINRRQARQRLREYHSSPRTIGETVDWALDFGGHGHFKFQTQQIRSEITALAKAVDRMAPKTILEIGTARGGTLLIWASIASELVVSCDLEDKSIQADLLRAFPPPGSGCRVELVCGDSHEEAFKEHIKNVLDGREVDFLFIDGDHTLDGVTQDFEMYSPLVRSGGLVAFHDIAENQVLETNNVFPLWQRLKKEYEHEEFIADRDQFGYGIGVLTMP